MSNKLNNEESSVDPDLQKILDLQEQGYTDEQIKQIMGLDDVEETPELKMPDIHLNLSEFEYEDPFEAKPPKPSFFKGKDKLKAFRGGSSLKSNMKYTLNGQERYCKKVNLRDVLRLAKKTPAWAMYIGYKTPEMLVDDMTGQYRIMETILALAERAFGDFDIELDQPTDFSLSVLEEVCRLLDLTAKEFGDPVDYLLEQDPEEVFEALSVAIRYNQGFFYESLEQPWSYQKHLLFDFWADFRQDRANKADSEPREDRDETDEQRRIREAFSLSWWDVKWWRSFFVLPIAKLIGLEATLDLDLVEAFGYRDAISDMNEFEAYSYWFDDFKREKDKPEGGGIDHSADHTKPKLKRTEKNRSIVDHAMESADNYLMFFKSRGYDQSRAIRKPKN